MAKPSSRWSEPVERTSTRCAIYTRKSTEDGLEQEFNSLDAQREACAAYILSQRHEGWTQVPDFYDDGGFSGGSMDRPGLRQLLAEVQAGNVDVIVVYKVDRLTRSLADFAKIVEVLDAADASFVSVTQSFNTTTSMGRLTLNVLLSFAQFEREVTGERIRDKIAASKAKGMWMGGNVPLGYDVHERKLVVNEADAVIVRSIFARYLKLGSVVALQEALNAEGICSKPRVARTGRNMGGLPFSRGALYLMLQNRTYLGEVWHKGIGYPGEHTAIVDASLFETAQVRLDANRVDRQRGTNAKEPSLLAGLVWDGLGRRMAPSHAVKAAKRYRYYISRIDDGAKDIPAWRVPAGDLEEAVSGQLRQALDDPAIQHQLLDQDAGDDGWVHLLRRTIARLQLQLRDGSGAEQRDIFLQLLRRVEIHKDRIDLQIDLARLIDGLEADGPADGLGPRPQPYILSVPAQLVRAGKEVRLAIAPSYRGDTTRQDPALIKLIIKAHAARAVLKEATSDSLDTIAAEHGVSVDYFKVLVRLSYLAPDITTAILDGRQPATLTRQKLARFANLPIDWVAQRQALGFI